ncbi:MAG TPA: diacylglycerol kinase family protein [Candidatus Saccharimonadales bacterium]|jgi:diacylglycerol kinase family enzyme|nr:diacylglycerol kinase family protein [Candidatus Saccharimonadales bacterium]
MKHLAFTHALVLRNPASTHAAQGKRRIAELQKIFGYERVVVIETVAGGAAPNQKLLRQYAGLLGPHALLCIAAGDGTVNMAIETLLQMPGLPESARKTPILPLWGGNANDLAHMLNGTSYRTRLATVLTKGEVVAIHPLACKLTPHHGKPVTRIAACYASFGATAFAAAKLNEPRNRNNPLHRLPGGRFIVEFITGFSALMEAPTFAVKEQGNLKIAYERTFANGSRFAKIDRLPLKLTDHVFYLHTLENKRLLSALPRTLALMQKRLSAKFTHDRDDFTVHQTTFAQFDGEPAEIAAQTNIHVTLSERPFYALSLLLRSESKS